MKIRYLKITGDSIKPLPDRMQDKATHQVNLTNAQYAQSGSGNDWKLVEGEPVLLTQEERDVKLTESIKNQQIADSESLRDSLLEELTYEVREDCWIKTRKKDYTNLKELINDLEPLEVYPNFTQQNPEGNVVVFDVTREELETAFQVGKLQTIDLHQQHALRVKAIQSS